MKSILYSLPCSSPTIRAIRACRAVVPRRRRVIPSAPAHGLSLSNGRGLILSLIGLTLFASDSFAQRNGGKQIRGNRPPLAAANNDTTEPTGAFLRHIMAPSGAQGATPTGTPCGTTSTFSNTAPITIPEFGNASPYPSTVTVSGAGTILATPGSVQVTINLFSHGFPGDVGMVLVGPTGAALLIQDGAGNSPMGDTTYILSDTGATFLPEIGIWGPGTYKPTAYFIDNFPPPGPGTAYGNPGPGGGGTETFASIFGGTNANGVWSLYIADFVLGEAGAIAGGWSLTVTTNSGCPTPTPTATPCGSNTFSNTAPITIPDIGNASPYPSTVTVSGAGTILATPGSVQVTINLFGHGFPADVGMVLVGPTGAALLIQDAAGDVLMTDVTYTLSDTGVTQLPATGVWGPGTYKPTSYFQGDDFPPPGPGTAYGNPGPVGGGTDTFTSIFGGTNANGVWSLYIVDFTSGEAGAITGGWSLTINTGSGCPTPTPTVTPTLTPTPTPSGTPTPTPTPSGTPTPTPTPSGTPTTTPTPSGTPTTTPTPSGTPTTTPTPSGTPTTTPTPSGTPTLTPTPSGTPDPTPTPTGTPGPTPTPSGTPGPTPTPTPSGTPTPSPAQALNISTRMRVESGNNVLIAGFIITGNEPKDVAVRGIGPSLADFGVNGALVDPTLELRAANGIVIGQNDDWEDNPVAAAQLTALGLALQHPKESGLVATLQPGASYTAILAGKNNGTGVGLVEVYDTNRTADSQLANISTRGFVLTGNDVMIGGFILGGNNSDTRTVIRGIGPSLADFGLSPVLADPTLELHDSNGALLIENDNWQDDPASAAELTALGLALPRPNESGIFAVLPPGAFTAILAGQGGGTGIGLVEIYNVR